MFDRNGRIAKLKEAIVWRMLVRTCHWWSSAYMDQWESFKYQTKYGMVYVKLLRHEVNPDEYNLVDKNGRPIKGDDTMHDLISAHDRSFRNRDTIRSASESGCFHCLEIFPSSEVKQFLRSDETACCPRCGIDSVIPMVSGIDIGFLGRMHDHWFSNSKL